MLTPPGSPPGPYTIYVDLGKWKLGWAIFSDTTKELVVAGTYRHVRPTNREHRPRDVAQGFVAHVVEHWPEDAPGSWVVEWPKLYSHKRKEHQDIQTLLDVGHQIEALLGRPARKYAPSTWKGNVPKPPHHKRLRRELANEAYQDGRLRDNNHDTWDAVGIGLFHLGRTGRGGVRKK